MNFSEIADIARYLDIAKRHLDLIERRRKGTLRMPGVPNEDHALVATIFSAAAVESGLNLFLAIPVLYVKDADLRSYFGLLVTQYLRLPIPQKLRFVYAFDKKLSGDKGLRSEIQALFRYRNLAMHSSPEYAEGFVDESRDSKAPTEPILIINSEGYEEIELAQRHYKAALDFLSKIQPFRPRKISKKTISRIEGQIGEYLTSFYERGA